MPDLQALVTIGRIVGVHGLRGTVKVCSYSDVPGRFEGLTQVWLASRAGAAQKRTVQLVQPRAEDYLVTFEGVDTPEAAKPLVGAVLQIPQEPLAPLPDDRYYECDLVGLDVRTEEGIVVGSLTEVLTTKSNAIFVVRGAEGKEHLIPATKEIVRAVDIPGGCMTVRRVPGLLDETSDAL